jgi:hypothetical protein
MTSPVAKAYQERHPDMSVRLTHRLTPDDVERIVDALAVDELVICDGLDPLDPEPASIERIKAALCGGSEEDYR